MSTWRRMVNRIREIGNHNCPTCGQMCGIYKQSLIDNHAVMLIGLYNLSMDREGNPYGAYHQNAYATVGTKSHGFALCAKFGLIGTPSPDEFEDKKYSGRWYLTRLGRQFVEGKAKCPASLEIYNNKIIKFSKKQVSIIDVLGTKFSYKDLMSRIIE